MEAGFSVLGLSEVTMAILLCLQAISPIKARFDLSLSPPHPNIVIILLGAIFFKVIKMDSRASGVWA